jgi:hypothetical protein
MRGLNEWLDRDVRDRQSELRGVAARVDQLREDLGRLASGMPAQGMLVLFSSHPVSDMLQVRL